jgi:hypothetical protein
MMAKVKAPYVYDDTGLKNLMGGKICTTDRKDRIQNVLMTIIFHHVGNRIVIETACLELADILFILYLHMGTQTEYNS